MRKMQRFEVKAQYGEHFYTVFINGFGVKDAIDKAMLFIHQERSMQGFSFRVWHPTKFIMKAVA